MMIIKKRLFQGLCLMLVILQSNYCLQAQDSLPPDAEPGKCYVKCTPPDEYETVTDQIVVREGYDDCVHYGGGYIIEQDSILISETYRTSPTDPPKLKVTTERLLVREASVKVAYRQPVFKEVIDSVTIYPALTKWIKEGITKECVVTNPNDCVMWCLTTTPAQYQTYTRWETVQASGWEETPIPAKYLTIEKTVVERPSQTGTQLIAAKYMAVEFHVLASTGGARCLPVPAEYITITTQKMSTGGLYPQWVEAPCKGKNTKKP